MSNVIGFLERMGQDAQLRHAATDEVNVALANAGIGPALQAVILGNDKAHLEALLGARTNVLCLVAPGKGEDDEDDESPDRDDDEVSGSAIRHVATAG